MTTDTDLIIGPLEVGPVAHGGHCVARHDGRVIFVRHGLPGERVLVRITDQSAKRFWRGDVVDVVEPSADRIGSSCPISGPGGCGGCDFQHVDLAAQRRLKTAVVAEQLSHLAGIDWEGTVQSVPDPDPQSPGLRWRSRMRYQVDEGRISMRVHRSHRLVELPEQGCAIAAHDPALIAGRTWQSGTELMAVQAASGAVVGPDQARDTITELAAGREWRLSADGFWQVHPAAADTLVRAVLDGLTPEEGERAFDLYCGVGLFTGALADAGCRVWGVESSRQAIAHARRNLADVRQRVRLTAGRVESEIRRLPARTDLVVLDPPRSGAGRAVMTAVAARHPRRIAYVACDPAALGRDLGLAHDLGYRPVSIEGFDLFPMTHHVECVAVLEPAEQ